MQTWFLGTDDPANPIAGRKKNAKSSGRNTTVVRKKRRISQKSKRKESNKKYPVALCTSVTMRERETERRGKRVREENKTNNDKTGRRRKAAGTVNSSGIEAINTQRPNFVLSPSVVHRSLFYGREEETGGRGRRKEGHRSNSNSSNSSSSNGSSILG